MVGVVSVRVRAADQHDCRPADRARNPVDNRWIEGRVPDPRDNRDTAKTESRQAGTDAVYTFAQERTRKRHHEELRGEGKCGGESEVELEKARIIEPP